MKFENILILSALLLAGCSAFFSIVGIVGLFSGAAISVGIMAGVLEFSKLVSTTFLYRYWNKISKIMKSYLLISIIVLITITSMGIYGYLSSAYQISSSKFKNEQDKILMVESQRDYLTNRIQQSKLRIETLNNVRQLQESRLSSALTNEFLTRNPIQLRLLQEQTTDLIKSSDDNIKTEQNIIQSTTTNIESINDRIITIKFSENSKKDIKTFQFVADQIGVSLDTIARWFIFIIVIIFDPLALVLLLAYNITKNINPIKTITNNDIIMESPTIMSNNIKTKVIEDLNLPTTTPPEPIPSSIVVNEIQHTNSPIEHPHGTPPITKLKL